MNLPYVTQHTRPRVQHNLHILIRSENDTVLARQYGREFAASIGFTDSDVTLIAAAISELTRNILEYATEGEIILRHILEGSKEGIDIVARDSGPGISDVAMAVLDGFSTSRGFGLGLPGVKRIMDEFHVESRLNEGTIVTMRKWRS